MSFRIEINFTVDYNPETGNLIINGNELENADLEMLKMYGIDLIDAVKTGDNTTFKITDKAVQFIKERYYKN